MLNEGTPQTLDSLIEILEKLRAEVGGDVNVTFASPLNPVRGAEYDDEDYHNVYIF